jgi:two-component system NtrC family sensor kinase
MVLVRVSDNGCGIPEELHARIFEPFFSTKGSKGTGLGLAVVKKIITEHGGDITVHGAHGEGTTFEIRLPMRSIDDWSPLSRDGGS